MPNEDFWGLNKPSYIEHQQKLEAERVAFMANNPYGYNMQLQNIQTGMLAESEVGSNRAPPMLLSLEDFPSWRGRFETHLNGQDTSLWQFVETKYERPIFENTPDLVAINSMTPEQRKNYDSEKKAYAHLTQALPRTIFHQFAQCKTTYDMWKAIELRVEGDEKMRQVKVALIKREFEALSHIGNESLSEMIKLFYHLMTKMENYKIVNTANELVKRFADGLLAK